MPLLANKYRTYGRMGAKNIFNAAYIWKYFGSMKKKGMD